MSEQQSSLIGNILAWWGGLPNQRAERALLRRAHSLTAIELCPAYHRAYSKSVRVYQTQRPKKSKLLDVPPSLL